MMSTLISTAAEAVDSTSSFFAAAGSAEQEDWDGLISARDVACLPHDQSLACILNHVVVPGLVQLNLTSADKLYQIQQGPPVSGDTLGDLPQLQLQVETLAPEQDEVLFQNIVLAGAEDSSLLEALSATFENSTGRVLDMVKTTIDSHQMDRDDFPRTPLILAASGLVILVISAILFWVFCCRQTPDCKVASHGTQNGYCSNGYGPIPTETTPIVHHHANGTTHTTTGNGAVAGGTFPQMERNRASQNSFDRDRNGNSDNCINMNGSLRGSTKTPTALRTTQEMRPNNKDFKEWYV